MSAVWLNLQLSLYCNFLIGLSVKKTLKIGFDCVIAKEFVVFIFGIQCTE